MDKFDFLLKMLGIVATLLTVILAVPQIIELKNKGKIKLFYIPLIFLVLIWIFMYKYYYILIIILIFSILFIWKSKSYFAYKTIYKEVFFDISKIEGFENNFLSKEEFLLKSNIKDFYNFHWRYIPGRKKIWVEPLILNQKIGEAIKIGNIDCYPVDFCEHYNKGDKIKTGIILRINKDDLKLHYIKNQTNSIDSKEKDEVDEFTIITERVVSIYEKTDYLKIIAYFGNIIPKSIVIKYYDRFDETTYFRTRKFKKAEFLKESENIEKFERKYYKKSNQNWFVFEDKNIKAGKKYIIIFEFEKLNQ